jgi:hypothetical protein
MLRLACIENAQLIPWCADPDPWRAWVLSEVSVRAARLAGPAPDQGGAAHRGDAPVLAAMGPGDASPGLAAAGWQVASWCFG